MTTTTLADEVAYQQIQLISGLDTVISSLDVVKTNNSSLNSQNLESTFILHYFLINSLPSSNPKLTNIDSIHKIAQNALSKIQTPINHILDQIDQLDISPTSFNTFAEENISKITYAYYVISELSKTNPLSTQNISNSYNEMIAKLKDTQNFLQNSNRNLKINYSLFELNDLILSTIKSIIATLTKLVDSTKNNSLFYCKNILSNFLDNFLLALSNSISFLPEFTSTTFVEFRQFVSDFCYYSGLIDKYLKQSVFSAQCIRLLFFIDEYLSYYTPIHQNIATPLDLSNFAKEAHKSLAKVLGSSSNASASQIEQQLILMDKLFSDMVPAFEDTTALKGTVDRLLQFIDNSKQNFQKLQQILSCGGFCGQSRVFYICLVGIESVLRSLLSTTKSQSTVFNPDDVISIPTNYKLSLESIASKQNISYSELASLYVNPLNQSKKQKASKGETSQKEIENTLNKINESMNSIQELNENILPLLKNINSQLKKCSKSIKDKKLMKEYNSTAELYNIIIDGMQQSILININELPLRESIYEIYNILQLLDNSKEIKKMIDVFKPLVDEFNIEIIPLINFKKFIDNIKTMKKDSSQKLLQILIDLMKNVQKQCENFSKTSYEVKDANSDLANAADDISNIIDAICTLNFSNQTYDLLRVLFKLRHHISSVRSGVIFDTPKDFLSIIKSIYDELSSFQNLIRFFLPTYSVKSFLTSLEIATWKLSHLKNDYKHDDLLNDTLSMAIDQLNHAISLIKDKKSNLRNAIEEAKKLIQPHVAFFNSKTARTNENFHKMHDDMNQALSLINQYWDPPEYLETKSDLDSLYKSLCLANSFCSQPDLISVSFIDPLETIKSTPLENFIRQASKLVDIKMIYKIVGSAILVDFPKEIHRLKKSVLYIQRCLTDNFNCMQNPQQFVENISVILASSVVVGYGKEDKIQSAALSMILDRSNLSFFDMNFHASNVLNLALGASLQCSNEIILDLLNILQSPPHNSQLPNIAFLVYSLIDLMPQESFLKEYQRLILTCYQGQNDISKINFAPLVNYLAQSIPDDIREKIYKMQNEIDFIFKTKPYIVYNTPTDFVPIVKDLPYGIADAYKPKGLSVVEYFPKPHETIDADEQIINEDSFDDKCDKTFSSHEVAELLTYYSNTSTLPDLNFRKLSNISSALQSKNFTFPDSLHTKAKNGYLSITVTGFKSRKTIVCLYLYDIQRKMTVSQPFYIGMVDSLPCILNTHSLISIIEISERSPNIVLIARALQQQEHLIKQVAVSAIRLFTQGGFLIFSASIPDRFHAITNSQHVDDKNIVQIMDHAPINYVEVQMNLKIRLLHERPQNVDALWLNNRNSYVYIPRIDIGLTLPIPFIFIRNISMNSEKEVKNAKFCYFIAEIIDENKGKTRALSFKNDLEERYISPIVPYSKNISFPDIIQFKVAKDFSPSSAMKISFRTIDAKGKESSSLFTTFKFFNQYNLLPQITDIKLPLNDETHQQLALFQETSSFVTFSLKFPSSFVPPQSFIDCLISQGQKAPVFKGVASTYHEDLIPPIVSVYLKNASLKMIKNLVLFLSTFNSVYDAFSNWIYGCFNTNSIKLSKLIDSYAEYIDQAASFNDYIEQLRAIKTCPYFIDIILSALFFNYEKDFSTTNLTKMCKGISKLIALLARTELSRIANDAFCKFMFFLSGVLSAETLAEIISMHINSFDGRSIELFSITAFPTSQDPEQLHAELLPLPIRSLSMLGQFSVFSAFASSPFLLAVASFFSKFRRMFSILFSKLEDAMETNNIDFIRIVLQSNAKFIESSDCYASLGDTGAQIFFPYIEFAAKH